MPSFEYDLRYVHAGAAVLEEYLLSNDVYWPAGVSTPAGEPPYPPLTLSGLGLARVRLQAFSLEPAQQTRLDSLIAQIDSLRARWRTAWGKKARAEFHARLNLWRDYLMEYRESPGANFNRYAYEVTRRVQLHLLKGEAEGIPSEEVKLLDSLDGLLRAVFQPGEFVWDAPLAASFPPQAYWYLYGNIKK